MVVASLVVSIFAVCAVMVVGFYQGRRLGQQVDRMRESWQAQNAIEIARDLQSDRQREARRTIYSLAEQCIDYTKWTPEQRDQADLVLQQLATAAYFDGRTLLPERMLEEYWGNIFRRVYVACKPRIEDRAERWKEPGWQPLVALSEKLLTQASSMPTYPAGASDAKPPPDIRTSLSEVSKSLERIATALTGAAALLPPPTVIPGDD